MLSAPPHRVNHDTVATFYTPQELDEIVRAWANETRIDFQFEGHVANVVVPLNRSHFATVWYGGSIGEKILSVKLNDQAEIIDHKLVVGICGTGL